MAGETDDLVLELLRGMRPDSSGFRAGTGKRSAATASRRDGTEERHGAVEAQPEGRRPASVAATGSPVGDLKDPDTRIATPVRRRIRKAHPLNAAGRCTISEPAVRHVRPDGSSVRVGPLEGARV